ncbi:MAG: hypothetical protein KKB88_01235 [Nanoarchaeota archaeon]|nr:hypothetical protein [Nanoarchaeota archaeon]
MTKKKETERTITKNQLLMLQGLTAMRDEAVKQIKHIERTIAKIVQEPEDGDDYFGLVSDYMFEDFGAKQLLKNLGVKVVK